MSSKRTPLYEIRKTMGYDAINERVTCGAEGDEIERRTRAQCVQIYARQVATVGTITWQDSKVRSER